MKRRDVMLGAAAALLGAGGVRAQLQRRPLRIGWMSPLPGQLLPSFHDGLRELGYAEGRSYVIEERHGNDPRGLPAAVNDLVNLPVDLFFVIGIPIMRAVAAVTPSIPVVVVGNPIVAGVADSLSRPGRNFTGVSLGADDFATKWLELLRELVPGLRRLIVLYDEGTAQQADDLRNAGKLFGLDIVGHATTGRAEIEAAILGSDGGAETALVVPASSFFASQRVAIVELARQKRLPAIYEHRLYVEQGGLVSYGPNIRDVFRRAAYFVDRIVKGAKPAELPIELPTKYELVLNMKTAKELGLTISAAMLQRADEVIE
jgi:putative ABC transport system substrate-binding protein